MNAMLLTDGYKLDHRRQYPKGTEYVYSNWTPRSNEYFPQATDGAVVFGIQYFIKKYLINYFNNEFFNVDEDVAVKNFKRRIDTFLGKNDVGVEHIRALHRLGYLPIRIKALPEGSVCPIRVPMLTVVNTHPDFFWVTNFLETLISCELWLPMTSATTARVYRKELERHAEKTGFGKDVELGFLCHDFSMRGMAGLEASIVSGMGHLTSFVGSETIPAIDAVEEYYNIDAEKELIAATVPATEHSVMSAGGCDNEFDTYKRLLTEVYPSGYVSIVSDTWDLWQVVTDFIPRLKNEILARDGRFVVRPDSGDPVDIICGYTKDILDELTFEEASRPEARGVYQLLWETFGGTINEKGYKVLDTHIGVIYGDSITIERQREIYKRLEDKGFAATNLVLGIGSYTYQYRTRDSLGFAMKATWCQINGEPREIFKQPKTDTGMKNSLKGLIQVLKDENGKYYAKDGVSRYDEGYGCLQTVFWDGKLYNETTLTEIRKRLTMFEFKDHFNANNCTMRLLDDYKKHGNLIVAFDFDNTIYDYHGKGASFSCVENLLRECSELGFTMILFTANENKEKLDFCKLYCSQCGIRIDYVNESPVMNTRKPYYNILLDDRAGIEESYKTLRYVVELIKLSKICKR